MDRKTLVATFAALLGFCVIAGSWTECLAVKSFYTDVKAREIGDVVTVMIVEKTLASNSSSIVTEKETSIGTEGGGTGALDFIPSFGFEGTVTKDHEGLGTTSRRGSIVGQMAAVVVDVTDSGNLIIQGEKQIVVNDETEILVLKGIVRPQDVSGDNVVISTDIASTEITYKGKGMVSNYSKPSIITRLLTLFF
ncbi:MAG: flagellar basal body L-ring protein FlgH [bacterium]